MKKVLLAAGMSLAAAPMMAGPLLDEVFEGHSLDFSTETVNPGLEKYTDLHVAFEDTQLEMNNLEIDIDGDFANFVMNGVSIMQNGNEVLTAGSLSGYYSIDEDLGLNVQARLKRILADLEAQDWTSENVFCDAFGGAFNLKGDQVTFAETGSSVLSMETFEILYDVYDPAGACIIDTTMSSSDIAIKSPNGALIEVAGFDMSAFTPAGYGATDMSFDEDYSGSMDIDGVSVSLGGVEQVKINKISSSSTTDGASLAALVNSGYYDLAFQMAEEGDLPSRSDVTGEQLVGIWDALRGLKSQSFFEISGLEIVGEFPQMMTGIPELAPGSDLNVFSSLVQDNSMVGIDLDVEASRLVDLSMGVSVLLTELDPGVVSMPESAILMSAPLSIAEVEFGIVDQGAGDLLATMGGMDFYTDIPALLSANLGPSKGELFADWVMDAKNGGAFFSAAPTTPMPVMQAFVGFMGSWDAFGQMINAETSAQ